MATVSEIQTRQQVLISSPLLRILLGVVTAGIGGLMILLAFPPYGLWPLIWVGFVPILFAQHRIMPEKWSSLALAAGVAAWLGPYLARIMGPEAPFFFRYLGVIIAVICFFAYQSIRRFHAYTGYRWFVAEGVIDWVGFEMIRTFIPMLATNGFVGNTQASQAWLLQPVSIFTIYGLDLVIMLVNFALAQGALALYDRQFTRPEVVKVNPRQTLRWLVIVGVVLAGWIGLSLIQYFTTPQDTPTIRVAALQPGFQGSAHMDTVTPPELRFQVLTEQIREAAAQGAQLIVTPEMGVAFDPQVEHTEELRALAAETGAHLIIAYVVSGDTPDGWVFRNEAVLLTPSGEFLETYKKFHVFGEPPTPGSGTFPVYDTELGTIGIEICHDANYTDVSRTLARNGAQLIAVPTNEFGGVGEQLWTNAVMRAVENQTPVVFNGIANVSAIIDPQGRLLKLNVSEDNQRAVLIADVPLRRGQAPVTVLGDWLGWVLLALYVVAMFAMIVTTRRLEKAEKVQKPIAAPDQAS